jgi:hypothetical protein
MACGPLAVPHLDADPLRNRQAHHAPPRPGRVQGHIACSPAAVTDVLHGSRCRRLDGKPVGGLGQRWGIGHTGHSGPAVGRAARLTAERKVLTGPALDTTTSRGIQEAMRRARIILLDRFLTPAEHDRAEHERGADARIGAALEQQTGAGFAEYLAAAPAILTRWQSARNGENLTAGAIISAAVDARRAGYLSHLSRDLATCRPSWPRRRDAYPQPSTKFTADQSYWQEGE